MKKAFFFSLIILLVLGFFLTGKFHQSTAQAAPPFYQGLFAVNLFDPNSDRTGMLFPDKVYQNPYLRGVVYRTSWHSIQPDSEDEYDWSRIDEVFAKTEENNKLVELIIIPGQFSPPWAFEGVEAEIFPVPYGPGAGEMRLQPMPWDQTYLSRWFRFLEVLQEKYGNRASFVKMPAAGPTSNCSEMSLPPFWEDDPESLEKWRQHGYTSEKLINAWKQTFDKYYQLFGGKQYFSLAVVAGLPIPDEEERLKVTRAVTTYAINNYPSSFALQFNGLNAPGRGERMYKMVQEFSDEVLTGFMMATWATDYPEEMGDPDPVKALRLSIEKGLGADIDFLEIYHPDIVNPDMQETLAWAASAFNPNFLTSGWSQIAWPDISNYTARTALEDINADCGEGTGLVIAKKEQDWWQEYVAGYGGKNFDLQNNKNYFINISRACNWIP